MSTEHRAAHALRQRLLRLFDGSRGTRINEPNEEMRVESIVPEIMRWHYDEWHLSPLVKHGGIALISGVTGTRADGSCDENMRTEFVDAFEKLGEVLRAGGLDYEHIIEMTTFHIDMGAHLGNFREVRDTYLGEPWPAWSAIGTTELAVPGPHVEIKVTCGT